MDTDQVKSGIKHLFALYYATDLGYPPCHAQFMLMLQLALIGDSSGKDKLVKTTVALVNKLHGYNILGGEKDICWLCPFLSTR